MLMNAEPVLPFSAAGCRPPSSTPFQSRRHYLPILRFSQGMPMAGPVSFDFSDAIAFCAAADVAAGRHAVMRRYASFAVRCR